LYPVKKLQAYILTFLFLLPSVGMHLDLTFCCGQLDTIGISHQTTVSLSDCCSISTGKSCNTNVELVMPQQILDIAAADVLDFPSLTVTTLPYRGERNSIDTMLKTTAFFHIEDYREPPTQAGLQVFLC
jgi:hypothetical protein